MILCEMYIIVRLYLIGMCFLNEGYLDVGSEDIIDVREVMQVG